MTILVFILAFNIPIAPVYYTNYDHYYDLTGSDSLVYGATNGGLVRYNTGSGAFDVLTSMDGLRVNRQACVALDSAGYVWSGSVLGIAQIDTAFDAVRNYPIDCLPCSRITTVYCRRDTVFVGTTDGLLRIVENGTPENFADDTRLSIYTENGLPSNAVTSICADDSSVWVGTDQGLVRFTRDFYDTSLYNLNAVRINAVQVFDTNIYVAANSGLYRFSGDHFDTLSNLAVLDMARAGDSLLLAMDSSRQAGVYHNGTITVIRNGLPSLYKAWSVLTIDTSWFCGLGNNRSRDYYGGGIGRYRRTDARWDTIMGNSIASNHVSCATANSEGVFVTHGNRSPLSHGFSWLKNDGEWRSFTKADSTIPSDYLHRCVSSPDGRVWFGINYRLISLVSDSVIAFGFEPSTEQMIYISKWFQGMDTSVALWDIEVDAHCNLFLAQAGPEDKCWIIDSALTHVNALEPKKAWFFCEMALDSSGKVWRTSAEQPGGLVITDTKNTLFNTADDTYVEYDTPGGYTKNLRGIVVDGNDRVFMASPAGLIVHDTSGFSNVPGISNQDLFDVELDSEDRVWVMARDGLYFYEASTGLIDGITYDDMGLYIDFDTTDKEVIQTQGFEYDPLRNCFWIGAETGLLKLEITVDPQPEPDSVVIYPNPVVGQDRVRIRNLPADAEVSIYAINGRRLAENLVPDRTFGEVVWYIPGNAGSGLYFAVVRSSAYKRVYKFAVAR